MAGDAQTPDRRSAVTKSDAVVFCCAFHNIAVIVAVFLVVNA